MEEKEILIKEVMFDKLIEDSKYYIQKYIPNATVKDFIMNMINEYVAIKKYVFKRI